MNIDEIEKILLADDGVDDTTLQAIGLDLLAEAKPLLAEVKRLQKRLASINYTVREIIDSCRRMEPHDINNCDVCTWQEELATIEDETMGVLD